MPLPDLTMSNTRYRMPAEWAPHAATWIAWPHNPADWPGKFQPIPWVYAEIVRHLSRVEEVQILVEDARARARVAKILERAGANMRRVHFHLWPTDRVWLRDSGPIFVMTPEGESAITNWHFNAWAKYDNWHLDDEIPHRAAALLGLAEHCPELRGRRLVLEGGSIDVNGEGALLTTEECLLSEVQQRNPGVTRTELEQVFALYLGIDQTLWLNRGCAGDDTHGHVDDIARFVGPDTILAAVEPNPADENHLPLAENLDRLRTFRRSSGPGKGKPFEILPLPMPAPVVFEGQRLPASYANFYIANLLVLVPTFNDANDRHALNLIASCFPTREVVGIHAVDLVWGLGTLHCLTQQQPA